MVELAKIAAPRNASASTPRAHLRPPLGATESATRGRRSTRASSPRTVRAYEPSGSVYVDPCVDTVIPELPAGTIPVQDLFA
jgi:hypothetical protein